MKTTVVLVSAAVALAGCTRVIERPVPVSPSPSVAAGATVPPNTCSWAGQATSNGGMSCQQGQQFRCNNGSWEQTALSC